MNGVQHLFEHANDTTCATATSSSLNDASEQSSRSSYYSVGTASPILFPNATTPTAGETTLSGIQPEDVYCGRDRYSHTHPGNRRFRQLINNYREIYQSSKHRDEKTRINTEIVKSVKANGGRFMRRDDATGQWHELDAASAHEKVSHALRSARDPNRPKPKKKRQVAVKPPSDEEERAFQILAADQQEIFRQLREANHHHQRGPY